ncbi:MAG: 50S ribosomal protein L31 [Patescibacteria group bacterium]
MKKEIHPTYHPGAKIICACGNIINSGSTVNEMHVEICSKCHPFYTGKQKLIDTGGRIERFKRLIEKKSEKKLAKPKTIAAKPITKKGKNKGR